MCWNTVLVESVVEQRLAEARACAAQWRLLRSLRPVGEGGGWRLGMKLSGFVARWLLPAAHTATRAATDGREPRVAESGRDAMGGGAHGEQRAA